MSLPKNRQGGVERNEVCSKRASQKLDDRPIVFLLLIEGEYYVSPVTPPLPTPGTDAASPSAQ